MGRRAEARPVVQGPARKFNIPENPVTTGEKIKYQRFHAGPNQEGMQQEAVAAHLGVGKQLIIHWEADKGPGPRIEQLQAMSRLFGCHLSDLIGELPAARGFNRSDLEEFIRVQRVYIAYAGTLTNQSVVSGVQAALDWATAALQNGEFDAEE